MVDWQELGSAVAGVPNLKVAFTAHMIDSQAWFETPFAAVQRPCDGQEVPALRWADVGGSEYGMAVLNDCKYAYDALGTRLRLTLVRSGYDPDSISDVGSHEFHYSLLAHPGDWRSAGVVRQAAEFNQPLIGRVIPNGQTAHHELWQPEIGGSPAVIPACLKNAYDGSGRVLRLYESCGQTVDADVRGFPSGARVWELTVTEDKLSEYRLFDGSVRLHFCPWQVRTLLVEE
jgi:alpha-mannosidase